MNPGGILTVKSDSRISLKHQMESIYQELTPERIPWNLEDPPELLVDLVESQQIVPCEAVDLGCGAGNYAVWFASKGFQMTGIDFSPNIRREPPPGASVWSQEADIWMLTLGEKRE